VGAVIQHVWSLGGSGNNKVDEFGLQYIVNYNLNNGWYLYSNVGLLSEAPMKEVSRGTDMGTARLGEGKFASQR